MKYFTFPSFFLIPILGASANQNVPELLCRRVYESPAIDGVLNDPCWQEAHGVTGFSLLGNGGPAREQTSAYVLYDDSCLYVAFVCLESRMDSLVARCESRDGLVWCDDCVEVFIDTDHDHMRYYHVIANAAGIRYDEIGRLQPWTWSCDWEVQITKALDRWTVETAIPFWCMSTAVPQPGEIWGFNLNREEYRLGELSGWSPTLNHFHEPYHFGHLVFEPES